MPAFPLIDPACDLYREGLTLGPADVGLPADPAWSVRHQRLRGGRRDGVDLVWIDNGRLRLAVIPSRGMNLWRGRCGDVDLGWKAPITDGPVNPAFVDLNAWGGLGWLDGFDEWLARCGTETLGPPFRDGDRTYTLHGRISNLPAHFVQVVVDDAPPHAITIEGHVTEARMFAAQTRMVTRITTVPGSNRFTVRDEFTHLGDSPGGLQLLYHWNFGPPLLEDGARFLAPIRTLMPRDAAATPGLDRFDRYGPPVAGAGEQVFYCQLIAGADGRTAAMLRNRAGDRAAVLRFATAALPAFALWRCERGTGEGYVTGLEPATCFPNIRPFEQARGRILPLAPGETFAAEIDVEILTTAEEVEAVAAEVQALQAPVTPHILRKPEEPFAPGG